MTDKIGTAPKQLPWQLEELRDGFAKAAMQGIITTAAAPVLTSLAGLDDDIAKTAYEMADAMLRAREK